MTYEELLRISGKRGVPQLVNLSPVRRGALNRFQGSTAFVASHNPFRGKSEFFFKRSLLNFLFFLTRSLFAVLSTTGIIQHQLGPENGHLLGYLTGTLSLFQET
jgi:hypothetical protein